MENATRADSSEDPLRTRRLLIALGAGLLAIVAVALVLRAREPVEVLSAVVIKADESEFDSQATTSSAPEIPDAVRRDRAGSDPFVEPERLRAAVASFDPVIESALAVDAVDTFDPAMESALAVDAVDMSTESARDTERSDESDAATTPADVVVEEEPKSESPPTTPVTEAPTTVAPPPTAPPPTVAATVSDSAAPGRAMGTFKITCYALRGTTASGAPVASDGIAVDPRVIPLGTEVYIEGIGWTVARDTGGVIKGNILDIWRPGTNECIQFGRQHREVWIRE